MMNKDKLRSFFSTSSLIFMLMLVSQFWISKSYAESVDALFNKGISAYQSNNYVDAVKFLFAYYESNNQTITTQSQQELLNAINYSEEKLRVALATKEELDKHGHVSEVVIEASGKADSPISKKKPVPFSAPADSGRKKPQAPKLEKKLAVPKLPKQLKAAPENKIDEGQLKQEIAELRRDHQLLSERCNSKIKYLSGQLQEQSNLLRSCQNRLRK